MPNHVTNKLVITGPKKDLDAFKATMNRPNEHGEVCEFNFHQTVPQPTNIIKGDIAFGDSRPNWLNWNIPNWGTKWNCYDVENVIFTSRSIKITFLTAWSAPDKWLEKVSDQFPNLTFRNTWKDEGGPKGVDLYPAH